MYKYHKLKLMKGAVPPQFSWKMQHNAWCTCQVLSLREHITPALRHLHWLPVRQRQRIQYKLASLAFRALSDLAPDYLAGNCQLVAHSGRRSLRSAERRVCSVPRQNSTFGDRSFAAAGPRVWNELPFSLRDTGLSLTTFNAHLKTLIFHSVWGHGHLWHLWSLCAAYKCTYLLTYLWCHCGNMRNDSGHVVWRFRIFDSAVYFPHSAIPHFTH